MEDVTNDLSVNICDTDVVDCVLSDDISPGVPKQEVVKAIPIDDTPLEVDTFDVVVEIVTDGFLLLVNKLVVVVKYVNDEILPDVFLFGVIEKIVTGNKLVGVITLDKVMLVETDWSANDPWLDTLRVATVNIPQYVFMLSVVQDVTDGSKYVNKLDMGT